MTEEDPVVLGEIEYDDLHDHATIVVGRGEDATVVVDRGEDATVVVDRGDDATVVVSRHVASVDEEGSDDATVVVSRAADAAAEADVADADVPTVVVDRSASKPPLAHEAAAVMRAPTRRDRRRPAPAPVSEAVLRTVEPGAGPGVLDRYEAREPEASRLPEPPRFEPGAPSTRDTTVALPSVERRTRRTAIVSMAVFAGTCLLSLGGLVAIVATVFGELFG